MIVRKNKFVFLDWEKNAREVKFKKDQKCQSKQWKIRIQVSEKTTQN